MTAPTQSIDLTLDASPVDQVTDTRQGLGSPLLHGGNGLSVDSGDDHYVKNHPAFAG